MPYNWWYYPTEMKWAHAEGYTVQKNTFNISNIKTTNKATDCITIICRHTVSQQYENFYTGLLKR
jgi:hypothetical protein